ncbi:MAG: ComEC/Rec2 family competence protein, partial [candidate division Zixibacteria bacterium]|nr:ComEC/Rec2 family competence protein [candidate division Zixibacteria bacterium]
MLRKYPAVYFLTFIIAGIVLADLVRPPLWILLVLAAATCLIGLAGINSKRIAVVALAFAAAILFFAAFHYGIRYYSPGPNHISRLANSNTRYLLYGRVADWPDLKAERTEITISLDSIGGDITQPVNGNILLKISDTTTVLQRGDRIEFVARVYPVREGAAAGSFDYARYLKLKGLSGIVYLPTLLDVRVIRADQRALFRIVNDLRSAIRKSLYRNLSPTAAALAAGFLIGETRDIPPEVYRCFRDSGTLHLLAVSGSNVALVVLFFVVLMRAVPVSRRRRAVVLLVVIFLFDLLSYGEPSVVRASVMAALVILAGQFERRYDLNNIIAATAVLVLLFDPAQLYDVGFQLSFLIAWTLIFGVPRLSALFQRWHNRIWYRWLVFPLLISVVAQLGSLGLIALYFNRVPVISPVANLFIVPLVSVAVVGTLVLLLADLILPVLGAFVGSLLNAELNLTLWIVTVMGGEGTPLVKTPDL